MSYGNLNICTCGKEIQYVKARKPNGRMGVVIIHNGEQIPDDATIPEITDEYKNWLRERTHPEIPIVRVKRTRKSKTKVTETESLTEDVIETEFTPTVELETQPEETVQENTTDGSSDNFSETTDSSDGNFSVVSDMLTKKYETIDDAFEGVLKVLPNAAFSFWNENERENWLDIYVSNENNTIIGKIYEGVN